MMYTACCYNMYNSDNQTACQAENSFCAELFKNVHAAFGAVCTFVLAFCLTAIIMGAELSVLIGLLIIALIIIAADNWIVKDKEPSPWVI